MKGSQTERRAESPSVRSGHNTVGLGKTTCFYAFVVALNLRERESCFDPSLVLVSPMRSHMFILLDQSGHKETGPEQSVPCC